jgi:hypothetical protein
MLLFKLYTELICALRLHDVKETGTNVDIAFIHYLSISVCIQYEEYSRGYNDNITTECAYWICEKLSFSLPQFEINFIENF